MCLEAFFIMAADDEAKLIRTITKKLARKVKLNRNRRLRRKRNRKFFLLKLREARARRFTESLCNKLDNIFELEDPSMGSMDYSFKETCKTTTEALNYEASMKEVTEWQHQHQVAYWKSKAIALQMENQVLHKHIKELYSNQMQQYLLANEHSTWKEVTHMEHEPIQHPKSKKSQEKSKNVTEELDEHVLPPSEAPGEAKRKQMKEMYGDMAAKINGMETAMELNYEYCINKEKPPHWPNIPLKL